MGDDPARKAIEDILTLLKEQTELMRKHCSNEIKELRGEIKDLHDFKVELKAKSDLSKSFLGYLKSWWPGIMAIAVLMVELKNMKP